MTVIIHFFVQNPLPKRRISKKLDNGQSPNTGDCVSGECVCVCVCIYICIYIYIVDQITALRKINLKSL